MKPLSSHEIIGNWATLLLPINDDESIDFARLREEIDFLLESGVNGIYTNGTAGEFYTQTEAEFEQIHTLLAERCEKSGMPFQIGVSHPSPQASFERLKRAIEFKPSAVQLILPDWLPVNNVEAIDFLRRMAEVSGPIGLVLYNPPHAKRVLQASVLSMLKQAVPLLVGIKVSDGDDDWYAAMCEHLSRLSIFVPGHHLATGISHGVASGSYSNIACLHPKGAQAWYQLIKEDLAAGLEIEERIRRFIADHISPFKSIHGFSNAAMDKLLAAIGGWSSCGTRLRWPYQSIAETEAERIRPIARDMLPELFV